MPVPRTELLPQLWAVAATVDGQTVRVQSTLTLAPDTNNTYVYLQCLTSGRPELGGGLPATDVHVRLMDQDVPAPAGDDAPVPETGTTTHLGNNFLEQTIVVTFTPNPADQQLATGTTDGQGRVQLVVRGTGASLAGVLTTTTTIQDLHTTDDISQSTSQRVITEPRLDVYFLFDVANQPVTDSRSQPSGFVRNLDTKHLGSPDAPLVFRVPRPGLVVVEA